MQVGKRGHKVRLVLKRVLILEENTDHLELLTALLENNFTPIDIHTVETIEDCLDFLEQTEYDIVLTGCFIHNICITERLGHIVERAGGIPIIVISGSGDEGIAAEVIKLGASEYVVKTKKALEKIPLLVTKYFKKGRKVKAKSPKEGFELNTRLARELDHLMQKARNLTTEIATKSVPEDSVSLDTLFTQIQRLRKMIQNP